MGIIGTVIIGILAGFIASYLVKGTGFGWLINLLLGIAGSLLGGWIFSLIGIDFGNGLLGTLIAATAGAVIIIFVVNFFKK